MPTVLPSQDAGDAIGSVPRSPLVLLTAIAVHSPSTARDVPPHGLLRADHSRAARGREERTESRRTAVGQSRRRLANPARIHCSERICYRKVAAPRNSKGRSAGRLVAVFEVDRPPTEERAQQVIDVSASPRRLVVFL